MDLSRLNMHFIETFIAFHILQRFCTAAALLLRCCCTAAHYCCCIRCCCIFATMKSTFIELLMRSYVKSTKMKFGSFPLIRKLCTDQLHWTRFRALY